MEELITLKVKCPNCGARLTVKVPPSMDMTKGTLTCVNCNVRSPWANFQRVVEKPVQDETQIVAKIHDTIGYLLDDNTHTEYKLKQGRQLIGRMTYTAPPKADVPIMVEDRTFSRAQFYLTVVSGRDGRFHTYISEASTSNPTYVNNKKLEPGDEVGLKHNDIISAGNTKLRFIGTSVSDKTVLHSLIDKQKKDL